MMAAETIAGFVTNWSSVKTIPSVLAFGWGVVVSAVKMGRCAQMNFAARLIAKERNATPMGAGAVAASAQVLKKSA